MPPRKKRPPAAAGRRGPSRQKTEHDELLAEIIARCAGRRLWPVVVNPAKFNQRSAANKGFPDVMIIGAGGILFRELKTRGAAALRPEQTQWKHRLAYAGQDWKTWMPGDLASGIIDAELDDIETPDEYSSEFSGAMLADD